MIQTYTTVIGKYDWKTSLGTPRHGRHGDIKIILKKNVWRFGLDSYGSEHIPTARYFEHGNESSGYITGGKFLN